MAAERRSRPGGCRPQGKGGPGRCAGQDDGAGREGESGTTGVRDAIEASQQGSREGHGKGNGQSCDQIPGKTVTGGISRILRETCG